MQITPGKDPTGWASFNTRFRLILSPIISALCFAVVVLGSVYGFEKMLEAQFPAAGWAIALGLAFVIQRLNAVCVHFSTRMIAAGLLPSSEKKTLQNQRFAGVDITVGLLCLTLTCCICYVDFVANREGNHAAVEQFTVRPDEKKVDMTTHNQILAIAQQARNAEAAAESRERDAWASRVDADINRQRRALEARRNHLAPVPDRWARVESARIERTLAGLERQRADRKAEFQPKTSNLAGKEKELADIAARQATAVQQAQGEVQATNTRTFGDYESRKESRKGGMFFIYLAAMFLWHICHGMKQYRALKFDEKHPDGESPLIEIVKTIGNGLNNALWTLRAKIYDWLPEDEIKDATKSALFDHIHTAVCQDVLGFITAHDGVNEMAIYLALKRHDTADVRHSLRVLKTARLAFENSGLWTADKAQAAIIATSFT